MNVSADLRKLQQLESSASQTELVRAIHFIKRRLPSKNNYEDAPPFQTTLEG